MELKKSFKGTVCCLGVNMRGVFLQGRAWQWGIAMIAFLSLLTACAVPTHLYIFPGHYLSPVQRVGSEVADIIVTPMRETFNLDENLGWHFIGKGKQQLRVKTGLVAKTADALLGDVLVNKGVSFVRQKRWDESPEGLADYNGKARFLIGGNIGHLEMSVKTDLTRVTSRFDIRIDVDCLIGVVAEQKIVRKTVHMNKKVLRFSASQKVMESVLDDVMTDVVKQISSHISEYI